MLYPVANIIPDFYNLVNFLIDLAEKKDATKEWCDFSSGTISNLFKQGIGDALKTLAREVKIPSDKSNNFQAAQNEIQLFLDCVKKQGANQDLIQSAKNVSVRLQTLQDAIQQR